MTVSVPERRVDDAVRALRIQDLELTWRYSIGNPYEEFSFPESVDVAEVLAEQGFAAVARSILRTSLTRPPNPYPNWKRGERLLAFASYYRLTRDRAAIAAATPVLAGFVAVLGRQIDASLDGAARPRALLVGHPRLGARPAFADDGLAGAARDGERLGGDRPGRARRPGRRLATRLGTASGARSTARSSGCPTARCSCRRGCSTASARTAR